MADQKISQLTQGTPLDTDVIPYVDLVSGTTKKALKSELKGDAATIAVGTTSTLSPGSSATVANSGTSSAAVFDFGIPAGQTGATGATGATGPIGMDWKGAWVTSTSYALTDGVYESGSSYICIVAHTSGTFATDLAAGKWSIVALKGTDGIGAGDVLGPATNTDGYVPVWNGTDSKTLANGFAFVDNATVGSGITGSIDGNNKTFVLSFTPSPAASLQLFVGGQFLLQGVDYTLATATITMVNAPQIGQDVVAFYRK